MANKKIGFKIRSNDRVIFAGKTGSGKTYAARKITANLKRLIVFDSKGSLGDWNLLPWDNAAHKKLMKGEPIRARVLAPIEEPGKFWESVMRDCFEAGSVTLYIDELYAIIPPQSKAPDIFAALYTRGREPGIGVWAATQRPTFIPLFAISEADHYFVFRLTLDEDRKRMAGFMGVEVERPISDLHGFYYSAATDDRPQYWRSI